MATWPSGKAGVCKTPITGSNPVVASKWNQQLKSSCAARAFFVAQVRHAVFLIESAVCIPANRPANSWRTASNVMSFPHSQPAFPIDTTHWEAFQARYDQLAAAPLDEPP
jgi:hypothetical protein